VNGFELVTVMVCLNRPLPGPQQVASFVTFRGWQRNEIGSKAPQTPPYFYFAFAILQLRSLGTMIVYWLPCLKRREGIELSMRLLRVAWIVCLPMVFFVIGNEQASAQYLVAAKILSVDGPVEIRRGPSTGATLTKVKFKPHDELKTGDRIITGWGGRLVLGLTDGSQAIVGERTIVEVRDLGSSPRELFHVLRGKTRVYIEKLGGRPNPYRINTPTAIIAVRGTLFDIVVKTNETEVFVHEGSVVVSGLELAEQTVYLSARQRTRVRRNQAPTPPSSFEPGRNDDSFRPIVDTRPVAEAFDLRDGRIEDTTLTPRIATPTGRQGSNTPQPVGGQRAPARRP